MSRKEIGGRRGEKEEVGRGLEEGEGFKGCCGRGSLYECRKSVYDTKSIMKDCMV